MVCASWEEVLSLEEGGLLTACLNRRPRGGVAGRGCHGLPVLLFVRFIPPPLNL